MTPVAHAATLALESALGRPVHIRARTPLGGGDISQVERLTTSEGSFVLKSDRHGIAGLFPAEADGLDALTRSGTSLRVPRVIAVRTDTPTLLILEDLGVGARASGFDDAFGRGLAELHRSRADRFGFMRDNFCGATTQPNPWTEEWIDFYAHSRLLHQLRLAARAGLLSGPESRQVERLISSLSRWLTEPPDGPALIHGDLWSGNLHVCGNGAPGVIDPAACYGHREAELGMMTLFGGFTSRMFAAYEEAFPLEPGWRERNPLYQLYHVMNHLNLFGGGYRGQVMSIVRRYV